jgi:hypothetical protein
MDAAAGFRGSLSVAAFAAGMRWERELKPPVCTGGYALPRLSPLVGVPDPYPIHSSLNWPICGKLPPSSLLADIALIKVLRSWAEIRIVLLAQS